MKILHVEAGRHLYGGALQVLFLLRGLRERGIDSVLVCPPGAAIGDKASALGVHVEPVPLRGDADLAFIPRLRQVIRREAPDVLHLHSRRGADVLGGLAGRLEKVPVVLSRRVDNPEPRWLVALKYRLYDQVITISEGIREVLLREGLQPDKVRCVHSAIDTDQYRPGCPDRGWFRSQFGLEEGEKAVGMIAQLIPRKGHHILLEAIPAVLAAEPGTRFILFGQGPEESTIREAVRSQGIGERVVFAGFRDDLDRVMPCLDVVAHPAFMEGLGVSLLQSAACGVPIVGSAVGGIPEIITSPAVGQLIAPGDHRELARAIINQLQQQAREPHLVEARRQSVETRFSIEAMVTGNLACYRDLETSDKCREH